ncbi:MAG: putative phosphoglycerate mutase [Candidatus Methanoperedens nitroreducens]|uniref:Putative phosphoglycerate mutase n=1 Tax=Candidatus Methanoperedens nitratireducens TaxID=1392998 RepID=A0A0P8CGW7_9EURY|nr:sulfatase-like hydrolase/transferase [Candidatus Methanoperedens sp. BLZ2]KAB2944946.1 MAG: alkaline phosphatase family protein [Candidatus Methanoperedens sp.]KPQ41939.1 MAG: putative phosphoglycerate mutase [Candidatus Methanoperedens sp. BLZ1]MBZ0177530.1 sulfatase-like hydrolase/transferase [Candidatus Methanoperedens nitroreducens]
MIKNFVIILLCILLFSTPYTALAVSEVTLNEVKRPQSAILFIVDGFGSSYYYPETSPLALDGSLLSKAKTGNLSFGARIADIRTKHPVTGIAHSMIVTGFSDANEETVGYPGATIFDITREHGFVNLAIMQRGDFMNMRSEQDIILFAENNSIDEPLMSMQTKNAPDGVYDLMYEWKMKLPAYLDDKKGVDKYSAYNRWGIDAANAAASDMIKKHPSRRFLLTVNIGAIDSGGHNMGDDDYMKLIESLDSDIYPLYKTALDNNIAFFLTADHGMSFATMNSRRGGHSSDKYSTKIESLKIPLVILSPNAVTGIIGGEYQQEDLAPTLLGVLDLPDNLQYGDGNAINIKKYASIYVKADSKYQVSLWNNDQKLSERSDSELIFSGLPLNSSYTLKATGDGGTFEEIVSLDSDKQFSFKKPESSFNISNRRLIAIILILIVNIAGLIIIRRIKD